MKKISSVQNFLNVLSEHNFVDLFQIRNYDTEACVSMCFLKYEDARHHLNFLIDTEQIAPGKYYIAQTSVYFG